jgi:hypothetical protein
LLFSSMNSLQKRDRKGKNIFLIDNFFLKKNWRKMKIFSK